VGNGGVILRGVAGQWLTVVRPRAQWDLAALSFSSPTDGWAVGFDYGSQSGLTLRWDGADWNRIPNPTIGYIVAVDMIGGDAGWAVAGKNYDTVHGVWRSTVLVWNGAAWVVSAHFPGVTLRAIGAVSAHEAWAVGETDQQTPVIYRTTGSGWAEVPSPAKGPLTAISVLSANDVWTVGLASTVLRWSGSSWQAVAIDPMYYFMSIEMLSPTEGWITETFGYVYHWTGQAWQLLVTPTRTTLRAISLASPTEGWAVGDNGTLLAWNGSIWTLLTSASLPSLSALDLVSPSIGWAGGFDSANQRAALLRWDGLAWTAIDTSGLPAVSIMAIDLVSATDGWAVGSSLTTATSAILRWNGSTWQAASNPAPTSHLTDVQMLSSTEGWIVGYDGTALYWDGASWTRRSGGLTDDLQLEAVAFRSPTAGWAVGQAKSPLPPPSAALVRWDGSSWIPIDMGLEWGVFAIAAIGVTDLWTSGDNQDFQHSDGNTWRAVTNPTRWRYTGIHGSDRNDLWAVGDMTRFGGYTRSQIAHWDGFTWWVHSSPTPRGLAAIRMSSPTSGWAVGAGVILQYTGTVQPLQHLFLPTLSRHR